MDMSSNILPPGQHRYDPIKRDLDPVGFALDRVQTLLVWIEEHRASVEKALHSDAETAERELSNLRVAARDAMIHMRRLSELILAGHTINPDKRLPESLRRCWFSSRVEGLLAAEEKGGAEKGTGQKERGKGVEERGKGVGSQIDGCPTLPPDDRTDPSDAIR